VTAGLKYKFIILIFREDRHHLISYGHAEHTHKFLMQMLFVVNKKIATDLSSAYQKDAP
jgi:hypothetical protein